MHVIRLIRAAEVRCETLEVRALKSLHITIARDRFEREHFMQCALAAKTGAAARTHDLALVGDRTGFRLVL